ncbi:MAG: class I SAM-dependent RNA methyltransferase, partial [Ruminococcaceae bacterium]|nr:class I SAM-dependent RNA methyltransferase [Oscillospiraceae bacterium]
ILIESALKALNIAPGSKRSFACERWSCLDADVWRAERERAQGMIRTDAAFEGFGSDISSENIAVAIENAGKAGVADRLTFVTRDVKDFAPEGERGIVICNPPYGERLLSVNEAQAIYRLMGSRFKRRPGFSYSIITPDEEFERSFGRKADKRRKLYNGMIRCQLYMYFK